MTDEVDEPADWVIACQREAAIRDLLRRHPKRLSTNTVDDVAKRLGLSRASLYRLIARFRVVPTADGLASLSRGRRAGTQMLDTEKEKLIQTILEQEYLKPTRPPLQSVIEQIRGACLERGWRPPTWRTVKARLSLIDARKRALRRKDVAAFRSTESVPGEYVAIRPLEVVQIDHTEVDIIVVDEQSREPIGRPSITLAIDLLTRMVTGFSLS